MPNIYVSHLGSNTSPYDTWAKAATTLAAAAAIDAAGDTIYIKNTHTESTAAAVTYDWAGTLASPTRVLCVSDSNEPPTTLATGAMITLTGNYTLLLNSSGDIVHFHGIRFKAGDSTNPVDVGTNGSTTGVAIFSNCAFELGGNNGGSDFMFYGVCEFYNCTFKAINSGSQIEVVTGTRYLFSECSIESGSTFSSNLFVVYSGQTIYLKNCDLSNLSSSTNICSNNTSSGTQLFVINCKMPSSWSGSINGLTPLCGVNDLLINSDSIDTNYRLEKKTAFGTVVHDTGIYLNSGAFDGTTHISWKMDSNVDAEWLYQTLDSPEIIQWNEKIGSALTVTCEFLINSATTLYTGDIWMEITYLGTSGVPLGTIDTDSRLSNYLAANTTECTTGIGVASWTGDGVGAKSYRVVSTITPQKKGFIQAVIKVAKASTTIYVDPVLTIT